MKNSAFTLIETIIAVLIIIGAASALLSLQPSWLTRLEWLGAKVRGSQIASIAAIKPFADSAQSIDLKNELTLKFMLKSSDIEKLGFENINYEISRPIKLSKDSNISIYEEQITSRDINFKLIRVAK